MIVALKHYIFSIYYIFLIIQLYFNFISSANFNCSSNEFILEGMSKCRPLLSCEDTKYIKPIQLIFQGTVKNIWLVQWNHHYIVMSKLRHSIFAEDFNANIDNLRLFNGNKLITRLIGICGTAIFTPYYQHGNALNLHKIFQKYRLNSFESRFKYCIDYVRILSLLHDNSLVMCDSNSLAKTLSQYLIDDQLELILNDLDALPTVSQHNQIKCGSREIVGDFVAPEQLWHDQSISFNNSQMKPYDEKVDIWKVPDICEWILSNIVLSSCQRKMTNFINIKCKSYDSSLRPSVHYILQYYQLINLICH